MALIPFFKAVIQAASVSGQVGSKNANTAAAALCFSQVSDQFIAFQFHAAQIDHQIAADELWSMKGWFWRFTATAMEKEQIYKQQAKVDKLKNQLYDLEADVNRIVRNANHELGLWSQAGVGKSKKVT